MLTFTSVFFLIAILQLRASLTGLPPPTRPFITTGITFTIVLYKGLTLPLQIEIQISSYAGSVNKPSTTNSVLIRMYDVPGRKMLFSLWPLYIRGVNVFFLYILVHCKSHSRDLYIPQTSPMPLVLIYWYTKKISLFWK